MDSKQEESLCQEALLLSTELREELSRLNHYAVREDALAVASVAYRLKHRAKDVGLELVERGAARIEESARKNNTALFCSEIDLLEHQVRWFSQSK